MKNTLRTTKYLAVFALFIAVVLTGTPDAHALELNYPEIPTPSGPIDLNCLEIGSCEASIAMFIVVFYGASVWVGGIIAFLALLYTGLTYILGGANPGLRNKAKNRFIDVVWGLAILLLVNAIIVTINPAIITTLEDPTILNTQEGIGEYTFTGFTFQDIEENTGTSGDGGGGDSGGDSGGGGNPTPDCAQNYAAVGSTSCTGSACGGGKTISLPDSIENDDPICNQAVAQSMLAAYGWDDNEQWSCLKTLWEGESTWIASATNPSSCAYGIPQSCPGDKLETSGTDWRYNPATQIDWGLKYIQGRTDYDDPCDAYNTWESRDPHWY